MNLFRDLTVYTFTMFLITLVSCNSDNTNAINSKSTMDVIHQRTSIRKYQTRPVTQEQLETLVKAGMAAPSAMNKQPWQFIIVEDKEILQALGKDIQTSKMVQQAPAAIIVCGDMQKTGEGWLQQYWIQDCSAASQNILLAITDMGLGGVWTSIYPAPERMKIVGNILNLPEHIIPLNIIPIGYPAESQSAKDKWDTKKVHRNKFGE